MDALLAMFEDFHKELSNIKKMIKNPSVTELFHEYLKSSRMTNEPPYTAEKMRKFLQLQLRHPQPSHQH
jgi:hypothetical protein